MIRAQSSRVSLRSISGPNAVSIAELAVEKGGSILLIPISARRQLNELSVEMMMKLSILYYADAREALLKALGD
jgi:ATP-dependent Lon protease